MHALGMRNSLKMPCEEFYDNLSEPTIRLKNEDGSFAVWKSYVVYPREENE